MRAIKAVILSIIVLVLAIFLPRVINSMFGQPTYTARIAYSEVLDKFLVQDYDEKKDEVLYQVEFDKNITLDEFMEALPFRFYSYLISKDKFPKLFSEWANAEKIRENSQVLNIKTDNFNQKFLPLYTLFESQPKYLKLQFNQYAIKSNNDGIEFIDLENLEENATMSTKFSLAMRDVGFKFPLKLYFTNPTTKKPLDEGAFVVDNNDKVFHIKMISGKPFVKDTSIKNSDIKMIFITENLRKEFYGALVDESGVYLISYDNYKLIKLPSNEYNPKTMTFYLGINPISKMSIIEMPDKVKAYKLNSDYTVQREFIYPLKIDKTAQEIEKFLFLFEIQRADGYNFRLEFSKFSTLALMLNFILLAIYLLIFYKKDRSNFKIFLIAISGVYGFIAAILY